MRLREAIERIPRERRAVEDGGRLPRQRREIDGEAGDGRLLLRVRGAPVSDVVDHGGQRRHEAGLRARRLAVGSGADARERRFPRARTNCASARGGEPETAPCRDRWRCRRPAAGAARARAARLGPAPRRAATCSARSIVNDRISQTVSISAWNGPGQFRPIDDFVAVGDAELAVAVNRRRAHEIADAHRAVRRRAAARSPARRPPRRTAGRSCWRAPARGRAAP